MTSEVPPLFPPLLAAGDPDFDARPRRRDLEPDRDRRLGDLVLDRRRRSGDFLRERLLFLSRDRDRFPRDLELSRDFLDFS